MIPIGTVPFSGWSVSEIEPALPPPAILADRISPDSGDYLSVTRGWPIVDGAVIQTFRTRRNTGAVARGHGHELDKERYVDGGTGPALEGRMRDAVAHLVREGVLEVTRVRSAVADGEDGSNDWAEASLEYTDRLTGEPKTFPNNAEEGT